MIPGLLLPFLGLDAALLSLWVTDRSIVWNILLVLSVLVALAVHTLHPLGLAILVLSALSVLVFFRGVWIPAGNRWVGVLMTVLMLGMLAHLFPGFPEHTLYANQVLTPGAYPTSLYWSFDKPVAGLLLMGWGMTRIRSIREFIRILPTTLGIYAACAGLILVVAWPMGLIRWAPKSAALSGLFALTNFLFVCIPEEAFFRGFLQPKFSSWLVTKPHPHRWSLILTSVLFGICHFAGGLGLMLTATIAGLFYGWAYQRTGRLEASILVHGLLNTTHYALFTYPLLKIKL